MPSSDYSRITITKVGPKNAPIIWAVVPAKGCPSPVKPTNDLQHEVQASADGLLTDMHEVAPSGSSWYLVGPCPNASGLAYMQEMQAQGDRQRAKAKQLASAVHGALLAQITNYCCAATRSERPKRIRKRPVLISRRRSW